MQRGTSLDVFLKAKTLAYLSAKIMMDYLLEERNFVWRMVEDVGTHNVCHIQAIGTQACLCLDWHLLCVLFTYRIYVLYLITQCVC